MVAAVWEWDYGDEADYFASLMAATATETATLSLAERFAEARPGWQERAACAGLGTDLFFSDVPVDVTEARRVCVGCGVVDACSAFGAGERFGVWGGR